MFYGEQSLAMVWQSRDKTKNPFFYFKSPWYKDDHEWQVINTDAGLQVHYLALPNFNTSHGALLGYRAIYICLLSTQSIQSWEISKPNIQEPANEENDLTT
jgi:hypothetical protein